MATEKSDSILDKIKNIAESGVSPEKIPDIVTKIIESESRERSEDRKIGWIDKVFGEKNTRLYLAFIITIISLIMAFFKSDNQLVFTAMIGLTGSCAGYMFGVGIRNGK